MLRSYIKIALRTLARQKTYSVINIGGLALGIAAAFVLGLYVRQELTWDRHFDDHDRIHRIATDFFDIGGFANSQAQLVDVLRAEAPVIERATRFDGGNPVRVAIGERVFEESEYLNVDTAFFGVFSYTFVAGSRSSALDAPDEVVLTDRLAEKYFGSDGASDAIGRVIHVGSDETAYRVAGVVKTPRGKSHLAADLWLPLEHDEAPTYWTNVAYYNYVKLVDGASRADLERTLDRVLRNHAYPASGFEGSFAEWLAAPPAVTFFVQPLTDIYLRSTYSFELAPGGNPAQVTSLAVIGVLILLIAGMNYVNLTTAYSAIRAREVGVKKALGAARSVLVRQFLVETVAFSLIAMVLAIGIAQLMLAAFTFITGDTLVASVFQRPDNLLVLLGVSLVAGLAAGVYPAFYLASFGAVKILKGNWTLSGNPRSRSTLVVVQFAIAIVLIISSLVVLRQLDFLRMTDKGFDHEGVVVVDDVDDLGTQAEAFRQQIEQIPQVVSTSVAGRVPLGSGLRMYTYRTPAMSESVTIENFNADHRYVPTLGMRMVAGRNFSGDLASDSSGAILNEAAVRLLELGDDPVGKQINDGEYVIGVVGDFNFQSLRDEIKPVVITYDEVGDELVVRIGGAGVGGFVEQLSDLWSRFLPDRPVDYRFMDDSFAELAAKERMLGRAISFFTILALVIAAMGLFGLAAFSAARRTKEIGVRKVLGASVPDIAALLSRDFLVLVLIAFGVGAPVAYVAMNRWLDGFAYHVDMGVTVFVVAGVAAMLLALVTVSYQAIRAAVADPVKALRFE